MLDKPPIDNRRRQGGQIGLRPTLSDDVEYTNRRSSSIGIKYFPRQIQIPLS